MIINSMTLLSLTMITNAHTLIQSLSGTLRRLSVTRIAVDTFKTQFLQLLDGINEKETEEFHKNLVSEFLKETYYKNKNFINTKGHNDLVIHNGETPKTSVGVIIEAKKPTNAAEMPSLKNLNVKAFHELILYYLRERITHKNLEIKHLVITNVYEWFIFDVQEIDRLFAQNKTFVQQFQDFSEGRLADSRTDFFYKQIAEPFIKNLDAELNFTHFSLKDFEFYARNNTPEDDKKLLELYKIFSPEHLLKLPFVNDSNTLDRGFYNELLHIMGLTEVKEGGKKLIKRNKSGERNSGSILEETILRIESLQKLDRIANLETYGNTREEQLFGVGLELTITWINRMLFLKLLEAQLLSYHKGDKNYAFLSSENFRCASGLDVLFFEVLAKQPEHRQIDTQKQYEKIPYLNSSLFEITELEHQTVLIGNLHTDKILPLYSQTVLKNRKGQRQTENLKTLDYLFAFLDAYDFGAEGKGDIQEENKPLITASVLGLVFEKINGYQDGSFFTPGFITMYMCKETLQRAVVQKFNEVKNWNCKTITDLSNTITDIKGANEIMNSLKICDPAVGSGHFLVSVLNEMIAIKSELGILIDSIGKRLKDYRVIVENDELMIFDIYDNEYFKYKPRYLERQRVQKTIFHEKQTIIENCLFGVDINPNSVKICRLRLWIELLKNAYYTEESKYQKLETLPNIDINIKCGNSLISKLQLNDNLNQFNNAQRQTIRRLMPDYKKQVSIYKGVRDREVKRKTVALLEGYRQTFLKMFNPNDADYLQYKGLENKWVTAQLALLQDAESLEKLQTEFEVAKEKWEAKTQIYRNAFEWRFEFPEVLDNEGNFVGFDVVVGNPPYGVPFNYKIATTKEFENFTDSSEAFMLLAKRISKGDSFSSIILPKSILFANAWLNSRRLLLENTIYNLVDTGISFAEVDLETVIYVMQHGQMLENHCVQLHNFTPLKKYAEKKKLENLGEVAQSILQESEILTIVNISPAIQSIFEKVRTKTFLKDFERQVFRGLYVPDDYKEQYLDKGNYLYINKVPDVSRYHIDLVRNIDLSFLPKLPTEKIAKLSQDRIIIKVLRGARLQATFCPKNTLSTEKLINLIVENVDLHYTLAIVNSKLVSFYFNKVVFSDITETSRVMDDIYLSKIPFPKINAKKQQPFIALVKQILDNKTKQLETKILETEIDNLVYKLYDLTAEEINIVESGTK